jgi:membrane protease YdiL (CAAX protease family)
MTFDQDRMGRSAVLAFFVLVFVLSLPFWLIGSVTGLLLAPGLPVSALAAFSPALSAAILVYREKGSAGVTELLKRASDLACMKDKRWLAPIVLLMPAVMAASYVVMRLMGMPVPAPAFSIVAAILLFCAFFVGGLGEELGWSGYAIEALQKRWGALSAALALGLVWAAWHVVPLTQAHRLVEWIAWWCLGTIALRVVMTWLYNNTGHSVFGAMVFHAMINVSWLTFPIRGSYYDPRVTGLIVAAVAVAVTAIWDQRRWRVGWWQWISAGISVPASLAAPDHALHFRTGSFASVSSRPFDVRLSSDSGKIAAPQRIDVEGQIRTHAVQTLAKRAWLSPKSRTPPGVKPQPPETRP